MSGALPIGSRVRAKSDRTRKGIVVAYRDQSEDPVLFVVWDDAANDAATNRSSELEWCAQ